MGWHERHRIYIIGAGIAGVSICKELKSKGIFGKVVAFLDDDPAKIGKLIDSVPVIGPLDHISGLINPNPDDEAVIAIPSGTKDQLKRIYSYLKQARFSRIKIIPRISQILEDEAHLIQTREVNPQDLLIRTPHKVNLKQSISYLRNKRVLITGAGGSIGSELSRQLLSAGAQRLYLFGHGENSIYEITRELKLLQEEGVGEKATIVPVLGELQDSDFVSFIINRLKADAVFHTAAHKHVPLLEENPVEAIKNNVFGTRNLVLACLKAEISRFVLISTDKAVEPCNVYGVSKFLAEEIVLEQNKRGRHFMIVRFGNVLGSRGSIVPLFQDQIKKGGPVTVTSPEIARYFMTIPEAASLVLKAAGLDLPTDLLVLDMGQPVNIKELAEKIITFYGFEPERDIKIDIVGLRPGEKMHEKLFAEYEEASPSPFENIMQIRRSEVLKVSLDDLLTQLRPICFLDKANPEAFRNRQLLKNVLSQTIPYYKAGNYEPPY
ncbi:MAG: polysaccharide biosynthesis protein [Spirochaetales bacterium]|nr:polysaccharide biosynthesis protein [Spirochaetales bacterium]